jgi:hypothetical protein
MRQYLYNNDTKSCILKEITERERGVIETMRMRLNERESLNYLQTYGIQMSRASLYRHKNNLKKRTRERLSIIAAKTFEEQHLERIDELELIKKLMWENYHKEATPYKRVMILREIKDVQRFISAYYEATEDFVGNKVEKLRDRVNTHNQERI